MVYNVAAKQWRAMIVETNIIIVIIYGHGEIMKED
jgi:hypothetical protein